MAQPVTRGDWLRFSVPVFSAMIDQGAGVGFLGQNVFYAGHKTLHPGRNGAL